ncbi:MAG: MFS transporter [Chlamydiota bacterium]|nr:MFS transporter [Chlamydiota bacterium]
MASISKTQQAYLSTRVLDIPLWAIYNMLPFILIKDLDATPFQIAVILALKPIVSVISMYWSSLVNDRPDRLRLNIVFARLIGCSSFFLFPFVSSPWFFIAASGIYMTLAVGAVPAWMEVLKLNLSDAKRKQTFAWGSAMGYLGGGILPILFGWFMDSSQQSWKWIFPVAALISLSAIILQMRIPTPNKSIKPQKQKSNQLLGPWISAYKLVKERSDFAKYQLGFMVIGGGLMLMQPALYVFFDEKLGLSYVEFAVALSLCKGVSYAIASPLWAKWMSGVDIFRFSSAVTSVACLFPILLMFSPQNIIWLYIAYIIYGITQSGNELSWNMSGPLFSGNADSSQFTSVNVVSVGLRGLIFPALGSILCSLTGSSVVLMMGCSCLLLATIIMVKFSAEEVYSLPENKV